MHLLKSDYLSLLEPDSNIQDKPGKAIGACIEQTSFNPGDLTCTFNDFALVAMHPILGISWQNIAYL